MLLHEAAMYRHLRPLQGRTVPRVYGLFACRTFTVLVLAHCGARVAQIGDFSEGQRAALYESLWSVHRWGVVHGDLRTENIVVSGDGTPTLIDFSHAGSHQCHDASSCEELRAARSFLLL
ncbi:hypothetical protein B0H15DRAFT_784534 [Mycena belliarum]|uniref:Aminoglycoside phosphotransferase domain-containing protein n=1 Tax=Mycena belliarum TaxID=1033014 RepID=A0AAD6U0K6_9AGAR|nr:hypothetical protein B0H15DRAFT_784534 [Mycena belliae]